MAERLPWEPSEYDQLRKRVEELEAQAGQDTVPLESLPIKALTQRLISSWEPDAGELLLPGTFAAPKDLPSFGIAPISLTAAASGSIFVDHVTETTPLVVPTTDDPLWNAAVTSRNSLGFTLAVQAVDGVARTQTVNVLWVASS